MNRPVIILSFLCGAAWAQEPLSVERPMLPLPLRSYTAPQIAPVRLNNSGRLQRLIRAGKLYLTVQDALALAIENNLNLEIARYGPLLAASALERAKAGGPVRGVPSASQQVSSVNAGVGVNGSTLSAGLLNSSNASTSGNTGGAVIQQIGQITPQLDPFVQDTTIFGHLTQPQTNVFVSAVPVLVESLHTYNGVVNQGLLTGGSYQFRDYEQYLKENAPTDLFNPAVGPHMDVTIRQPLLQGFGVRLNDRFIRIAQVNISASREDFRSQVVDLATTVINQYWDLVTASDTLKARVQAARDAQEFYSDTQKEISVGAVPRADLLRAEAELARTRQDVTIAQNNFGQSETLLKEALTRAPDPALEAADIIPLDHIEVPENDNLPPMRQLVATALEKRPDVAVSRYRDQTAEMALSGTENPLRPNLTAYAQTYNRGAAGTPQTSSGLAPNTYFIGGYGTAIGQVFRRNFPSNIGGAQFSIPLHNRQAQGDYGIDQLQFRQSQVSGQRDQNQIVVDVSARLSALRQARARFAAATDSETLQQQLLEADRKKFISGTATLNDVIIDQRSLVTAQVSVIDARSAYERARVALDEVLGETLEQNNIRLEEALRGEVIRQSLPALP
ncbi:MAG TPA: TolC family protein [Bryobacteraceae bacterium]|nr:TolC family protein [Bryobacteraceae bacterium]